MCEKKSLLMFSVCLPALLAEHVFISTSILSGSQSTAFD